MSSYAEDRLTAARLSRKMQESGGKEGKKVTWSLDPHEKQNPEHAAALRSLLPKF